MKNEDFEGLIDSIREGGQILRGEIKPSREFSVEVDENSQSKNEGYALCIKTDDPKLLIVSKIYRAHFSSIGYVGIVDEEGEAAVYPPEFFVRVEFPSEVEKVLESLQTETV